MKVRSRRHGTGSQHYYGCAWHQERGPVCANGGDVPMFDADAIVIEALLEDVLSPDMLRDAVAEAVALVCGPARDPTPTRSIQREIAKLERERQNYIAAIGAGGQLAGLLDALRDREQRLAALRAQLLAPRVQGGAGVDARRVQRDINDLAEEWRHVLAERPTQARPIVTSLLKGRVTFAPAEKKKWKVTGEGTLTGLFSSVLSLGVASPEGFSKVDARRKIGGPLRIAA